MKKIDSTQLHGSYQIQHDKNKNINFKHKTWKKAYSNEVFLSCPCVLTSLLFSWHRRLYKNILKKDIKHRIYEFMSTVMLLRSNRQKMHFRDAAWHAMASENVCVFDSVDLSVWCGDYKSTLRKKGSWVASGS